MKYVYDSSKDPKERLLDIKVNQFGDEENNEMNFVDIEEDKLYSVASREYTMNGGDGFEMFKDPDHELIVDDEAGVPLSVLLRNFFWATSAVNDAIKLMQNKDDDGNDNETNQKLVDNVNNLMTRLGVNNYVDDQKEDKTQKIELLKVEPRVEGRIIDVSDTQNQESENEKEKKLIVSPNYNKLPSYLNMTHKPIRKQSITAFISEE